METILTYAVWGVLGIVLALVMAVITTITKKLRGNTPQPQTGGPAQPPPLPLFWTSWTPWFRTWVIITALGILAAIAFVPEVGGNLWALLAYGVKTPAFGIGVIVALVTWISYNYENPLPQKHIINGRVGLAVCTICLGIWGWQLIGPNKLQHIGNWWKEFARILPSLVVSANQPPGSVRPSQKVFLTNQQSVHPSSPHSQIVTVRVSSSRWMPIEWLPDYNDEVFGSPRPVRVFYCRQQRMPDENQRPDGVMEKEGENPSDIPASISPLWVKAESIDPDTEVEFDLLVGFSR